jgi:hypothetical protein
MWGTGVLAVAFTAAVLAAGCSSSSSKNAASSSGVAVQPAASTTTQPSAIGLRTNEDEKAEYGPDKPLLPTVADARKAGYIQAGEFTPGAGAHFVSVSNASNSFLGHTTTINPANPLALIYEGTAPTSHVTGLMYGSFTAAPPEGFVGPNDHWHRHTNLCITWTKGEIGIPYPPDQNVKKSQCDALHGQFMRETLWMVHAWVVPGWDSPQGVFSHANIDLHCGDGTDDADATGFCKGTA